MRRWLVAAYKVTATTATNDDDDDDDNKTDAEERARGLQNGDHFIT
jgi:hypothetical protein